ncbi:hypothetical protein ACVWYO_002293 [Sphingomonas sp. UYP23]
MSALPMAAPLNCLTLHHHLLPFLSANGLAYDSSSRAPVPWGEAWSLPRPSTSVEGHDPHAATMVRAGPASTPVESLDRHHDSDARVSAVQQGGTRGTNDQAMSTRAQRARLGQEGSAKVHAATVIPVRLPA